MSFETILTVFLLLGIAALSVWLFSRTIHTVAKVIGNSLGGLCFLFLLVFFGVDIPINGVTLLVTLFGGGFGVVLLLLFYLFM